MIGGFVWVPCLVSAMNACPLGHFTFEKVVSLLREFGNPKELCKDLPAFQLKMLILLTTTTIEKMSDSPITSLLTF